MPPQTHVCNRLLAGLSARDFDRLSCDMTRLGFAQGVTLIEPGAAITQVCFFESGMASVVARTPEGHQVEAGVIGREGFSHPAMALDVDRIPYLVNMQMTGEAYCIARDVFADALAQSATLRQRMLRYAHVYTVQTGFTVLSGGVHSTDERLARWLLMCHDRSEGDDVKITHDFLAVMLAVRRPSVTTAVHLLEGYGLIRATRGLIRIRDREALQNYASEVYGIPEAEYDRLLGS